MIDPRPGDRAIGLELQLIELVERRERALTQGRRADAERIDREEIGPVQAELASLAEYVATHE